MYFHTIASGDLEGAKRLPVLYHKQLFQSAKIANRKHQFDLAISYLEILLDKKIVSKEFFFEFALALSGKAGETRREIYWQEADKYFSLAVDNNPNAYYYQRYAYICVKARRLREAEIHINAALAIDAEKPESLLTLALLKEKQHDPKTHKYFFEARIKGENNRFCVVEYVLYLNRINHADFSKAFKEAFLLFGDDTRLKRLIDGSTIDTRFEGLEMISLEEEELDDIEDE